MTNDNKKTRLSRRTFLKSSAASVALAAAVSPGSALKALAIEEVKAADLNEETVFAGACRGNCTGGCFLNVHMRDGKVVRTSARDLPDTRYNRICVKGLTHMHRIYHPERLKYPLKRTGARGEGKWERISWDEAMATIGEKWQAYQAQFGPSSVSILKGSGNYAVASGCSGGCALDRLGNVLGASTIATAVDMALGISTLNVYANGPLSTSNGAADLLNAKTILIWGANPVNSQQQTTHFILEAKENGAKLVVIDPVFTATAAKADIFAPIRPATDGVLDMAMCNIIIRENRVDWDFLKKRTVAPFLVKQSNDKFLRLSDIDANVAAGSPEDQPVLRDMSGKIGNADAVTDPVLEGSFTINGHEVTTAYSRLLAALAPYTPEKASEICDLPIGQIEEIARLYATNTPASMYYFFGMDHYLNGHYHYVAMAALTALTGNICKKGAYSGMNESRPDHFRNTSIIMPEGAPGSKLSMPILGFPEILATNKYGDVDINLKSLYCSHVNSIGNAAQRKLMIEQFNKIEFLVVADMNMNETAQYADILLPAAHWFETEDLYIHYGTHPYLLYQEKCLDPLYESKADYEIYTLLAQAMGRGEYFTMSNAQYLEEWLNTDAARDLGITMQSMREQKAISVVPADYIYAKDRFPNATGRLQFYIENPLVLYQMNQTIDFSKEHTAYWEPPYEAWHENPLSAKYPYILLNVHPKWRTHSQWWDAEVLREIDPEPTVQINPQDALTKNIKEGDKVKIFNDRGYVVMPANINNGMRPGCVSVPKGWEKGQFIDGHYQDLTVAVTNQVVANSPFFDVLVQIEKA